MKTEISNVRVLSTFIGIEDHGLLTCSIMVKGDGWIQSFGGYDCRERRGGFFADVINNILRTLEKNSWEDLKDSYCRVKSVDGSIIEIGHITENRWFNIKELSKKYS